MAIVVKQNQIQTISSGSLQYNCNVNAQNILQTVADLFASIDGWSIVEELNTWIAGDNTYPDIYTVMLQNSNTNEYMRLWFSVCYYGNQREYGCYYLTDTNQSSMKGHIYVHKNNLFRSYRPSNAAKYWAHTICDITCGISDNTIAKELGHDLGLKLPLFQLFYNLYNDIYSFNQCSLTSEGGETKTYCFYTLYYDTVSYKKLKFTIVGDDEDSRFVFITNSNNSGQSDSLRWSSYNKEFVTPANENDEYLQGSVFMSYNKMQSVFHAVDGSIQFGQYDTVLYGVSLPAGAASDEGIVASPLFLSSQLESDGLDVSNVDNGSGYKGQIKTDWLLTSNSRVVGTTHNQGTWLNVGSGILVPWSPDAGSPFIS